MNVLVYNSLNKIVFHIFKFIYIRHGLCIVINNFKFIRFFSFSYNLY